MATYYSLRDILSVASKHPFYNREIEYPPNAEEIAQLLDQTAITPDLRALPLTHKEDLYGKSLSDVHDS